MHVTLQCPDRHKWIEVIRTEIARRRQAAKDRWPAYLESYQAQGWLVRTFLMNKPTAEYQAFHEDTHLSFSGVRQLEQLVSRFEECQKEEVSLHHRELKVLMDLGVAETLSVVCTRKPSTDPFSNKTIYARKF